MSKNKYIEALNLYLNKFTNGSVYINISQLAKALGMARETTAQLVYDLKYLPNGREKLFFINDVALQIYSNLQCDGIGGMLIDNTRV